MTLDVHQLDQLLLVGTGSSDDWFLVDHPDVYPTIVGEQGEDTIDLRTATGGFDLTLGQDTFGGGHWLSAFEFEVILGSEFGDVLLGPDSAGQDDTVTFYGFDGNDYLIGGDQADFLRGGRGVDTLKGREGADTLFGSPGNDLLGGGYGPDELRGGGGDDVLIGGPGVDACVGGEGPDSVDCER